jgi:hypothetical protein
MGVDRYCFDYANTKLKKKKKKIVWSVQNVVIDLVLWISEIEVNTWPVNQSYVKIRLVLSPRQCFSYVFILIRN